MSMFQAITLNCPACGTPVEFQAVLSVNADRRPDLRAAILDGSFQRQPCPQCGEEFRLDPEFTFVDIARGQWVAAFPIAKLGQWRELEVQASITFGLAYGPPASAAAREIGAAMKPRITFGWMALREKLVVVDNQLDDLTLELVKLAVIRSSETSPLSNETELRLIAVEDAKLVMAWIRVGTEEFVETLGVPKSLYDDIAANPEPWQALRAQLWVGPFVDMNRQLIPAAT